MIFLRKNTHFRIVLINPFRDLREISTHVTRRHPCNRLSTSNVSVKNKTDITITHQDLTKEIYAVIWTAVRWPSAFERVRDLPTCSHTIFGGSWNVSTCS